MSLGHSGALQFHVHKNAGNPGIFMQKEKQKNEARKFGYKSKKLRHPIRQPDETEALIQMEMAKEDEKKKFNKHNKDFIRQNRQRYKAKEQDQQPPPGTTHIKPGTVTLTQDQLAALLASLGKTADKGGKDNPLKISIDTSNNKIEVEKYDSDDSGADVEIDKYENKAKRGHGNAADGDDDDDQSDVGITALLGGDSKPGKSKSKGREDSGGKDRERKPAERQRGSRDEPRKTRSRTGPSPHTLNVEPQPQTRLSWEDAKKEAGVGNVPDQVPWKHLTVAERKRLQWARERAELQEEYNPWGRPGAGAPKKNKQEETQKPASGGDAPPGHWSQNTARSNVDLERKRKQDEIANEIEKLRKEIKEAEEKKKEEEGRIERARNESKRQKEREEQKAEAEEYERSKNGRKEKRSRTRKDGEERKKVAEKGDADEDDQNLGQEDTAGLSKKELERRKWLEELDKQREEQRMRKQQEKERDRAGVQDQWADRFVYHKTTPREARAPPPAAREQVSVLGKAPENVVESSAPPAAMRSSMVVGAGTLNDNRYDNTKAQEKRKWLEELDRQREEQRLAKAAQKERDRQDDGTWADRYPADHQKLRKAVEVSYHPSTVSPRAEKNEPSTTRINSAPQQATIPGPGAAAAHDEPATFLRGQGAFIDPVTRKEQEEKRRVQLEYQAQVKAQIEEKERLKREERERKRREDMEEERKLQMERDNLNRQAEMEQRKNREREELRQKQISVLKSAMEEAQEKAMEEKNVRRIHHLQQGGHDISQLKATYEGIHGHHALTPRMKEYELTSIPGLGMDSGRGHPSHSAAPPSPPPYAVDAAPARHGHGFDQVQQSYTKEPYVEDRVLTPSRFRNPSKPRDLPDSPRREFGTQTLELKDLQAILQSLPDDIQIEYKMKVEEALKEKAKEKRAPQRKVHVKSAEGDKREVKRPVKQVQPKEKPLEPGERPKWNQRQRKTVVKNSERDPFYQRKKEEAELRREKRERQLLYLQELNKEKIPSLSRSPVRSRDASPEGVKPVGDRGRKSAPARKTHSTALVKTDNKRDASPNILSLINNDEKKLTSKSPQTTGRNSPPIPAVRHRTTANQDPDKDPYFYTNSHLRSSQTESKYGDVALVPVDDEFVPFMRTTEILDPSKADEPMAISRENSRMERARRAYFETHHAANKGRKVDVYQDREREAALKASTNPIMNPSLVTDHPTARQDMILQQLSSLKKTLMQRQKELEDYMSPTELQEETVRG